MPCRAVLDKRRNEYSCLLIYGKCFYVLLVINFSQEYMMKILVMGLHQENKIIINSVGAQKIFKFIIM